MIVCWAVALGCAGIVTAMEFAADGKILVWMPVWLIYLVDALCSVAMGTAAWRLSLSHEQKKLTNGAEA